MERMKERRKVNQRAKGKAHPKAIIRQETVRVAERMVSCD